MPSSELRMRMPASYHDCTPTAAGAVVASDMYGSTGRSMLALDVAGEPVKPDALMAVAASMLKRRRIESRGENAGKKSFWREIIITHTGRSGTVCGETERE